MEKRYIQLYSLKDEAAKDFTGTLKRVAEIGFTGVEFASGFYGGNSAADLKKILADLKLEALGTHIMTENVAGHLDFAAELGLKYIIDPIAFFSTDEEALAFSEKLNEAGKLCKERGIIFGYHNHRHEFLEGKDGYLLETMLLNTDPDLVCFQLDVGWATCAGVDVPAFLKKYAGRFKLIHVKECSTVAGAEKFPDFSVYPKDENGVPQIPPEVRKKFDEQNTWNVATGKGVIDWPVVKEAALAQGAEAFIVEREYDYAGDIFKCVKEDCEYVKAL